MRVFWYLWELLSINLRHTTHFKTRVPLDINVQTWLRKPQNRTEICQKNRKHFLIFFPEYRNRTYMEARIWKLPSARIIGWYNGPWGAVKQKNWLVLHATLITWKQLLNYGNKAFFLDCRFILSCFFFLVGSSFFNPIIITWVSPSYSRHACYTRAWEITGCRPL